MKFSLTDTREVKRLRKLADKVRLPPSPEPEES